MIQSDQWDPQSLLGEPADFLDGNTKLKKASGQALTTVGGTMVVSKSICSRATWTVKPEVVSLGKYQSIGLWRLMNGKVDLNSWKNACLFRFKQEKLIVNGDWAELPGLAGEWKNGETISLEVDFEEETIAMKRQGRAKAIIFRDEGVRSGEYCLGGETGLEDESLQIVSFKMEEPIIAGNPVGGLASYAPQEQHQEPLATPLDLLGLSQDLQFQELYLLIRQELRTKNSFEKRLALQALLANEAACDHVVSKVGDPKEQGKYSKEQAIEQLMAIAQTPPLALQAPSLPEARVALANREEKLFRELVATTASFAELDDCAQASALSLGVQACFLQLQTTEGALPASPIEAIEGQAGSFLQKVRQMNSGLFESLTGLAHASGSIQTIALKSIAAFKEAIVVNENPVTLPEDQLLKQMMGLLK